MRLIWNKYIFNFLLLVFLFLDIVSPAENMIIKVMIALVLSCVSILDMLKRKLRIRITKCVLLWFFVFIASGLFFTTISVFYENQQPTSYFKVYVIEPCIYLLLISLLDEEKTIYIYQVLENILLFVLLYNIVFSLSLNGLLPEILSKHMPYVKANRGGVSIPGIIKITSQNVSWFFFLLPCFTCKFFTSRKMNMKLLIILIAGLLNVILILRTALILGIIITPIVILTGAILTNTKLNGKNIILLLSIISISGIIIFSFSKINIRAVWEKVVFSFSNKTYINQYGIGDDGGSIRYSQLKDLIQTWLYKPLLGWGDGAAASHITRNEIVGAYELTYFAMLMQRGIIGMGMFILQIAWIYFRSIKIISHSAEYGNILLCILVGYTVFLLANMTNPYFQSFDRIIILFLPLFVINLYGKCEKNLIGKSECGDSNLLDQQEVSR